MNSNLPENVLILRLSLLQISPFCAIVLRDLSFSPPLFHFNLRGSMRSKLLIFFSCLLLLGCSDEKKKKLGGFDLSPLINEKSISVFEVADRDPVNLWGIEYPTKEELLNKWKPWLEQLDNVIVTENMNDEQLGTLACLYFYFIRSLNMVGNRLLPEGQTTESMRNLILNLAKSAISSLMKLKPILEKRQPGQHSTLFLSAEYDLKSLMVLNAIAAIVYAKIEYPNYLREHYGSLGHRNNKQVKSIEFFEEKTREIVEQLDESKDKNIYVNVLEDMILAHRTLFDKLYQRLYFHFPFYAPDQPNAQDSDFEQRKKRFLEYLKNACKNSQNTKR